MRLIPPNVTVVDADLDKHPLPRFSRPLSLSVSLSSLRSAHSPVQTVKGENFVRSGSIKLLYSQPRTLRGMCAFCGWLIHLTNNNNKKKKTKKKKAKKK